MRNDDTAPGPAAPPADRRPSAALPDHPATHGLARRFRAWALHGPPWTYVALAICGFLAALLMAWLKG